MLTMVRKKTPKPLDEYRREHYMSVTEFVAFLGITPHLYYSALAGHGTRPSTMRRIAEKLGVRPQDIREFEIKHQDEE